MTGSPGTVEANHLYWETDTPVADIAARFDLSRRALYETVQPIPAGETCSQCGGDLRFENRLARRTGSATCAGCGARVELASPAVRRPKAGRPSGRDLRAAEGRADDARSNDLRSRAVLLGGAALAGVAVGSVAAWLARRRD